MFGKILGIKQSQSQQFTPEGVRVPVTVVETSPSYLVGFRTLDDGRTMMMIGFGTAKKTVKPQKQILTSAGISVDLHTIREFMLPDDAEVQEEDGTKKLIVGEQSIAVGEELKPELFFQVGDKIDVAGTSKGKGFQGVVKRHGFGGGSRTHGQSDRERAPGSVGAGTDPGRILKGKRMAGRMGGERVTVKNVSILGIEGTQIMVRGLVPGARNGVLEISLYQRTNG